MTNSQEPCQQILTTLERYSAELINYEPVTVRQRQYLEEVCQGLGLDGLLAHSSVKELLDFYKGAYDGLGCVPQQCQVELTLLEKNKQNNEVQRTCQGYESRIQQCSKVLSSLELKENEASQILNDMKSQTTKQKQRLDKFDMDNSAFVRSQNQKLESVLTVSERTGYSADTNFLQEYEQIKQQIAQLEIQYCGEHPFPSNRTQAIELMNILDLQIQTEQVRRISKQ